MFRPAGAAQPSAESPGIARSLRLSAFSALVALAMTVLMWQLVHSVGFMLRTEFFIEDVARSIYTPVEPQQRDIVIVSIDDSTLDGFPYTSPIDRTFLKDLIGWIAEQKPRAIGVDILFDQPTEPAKDQGLSELFRTIGTPLVVSYVNDPAIETPERQEFENRFVPPALRGVANLAEDPFDTARYIMPGAPGPDGQFVASFPVRIAGHLGVAPPPSLTEIAWRGRPDADTDPFRIYPAQLVRKLDPAFFRGKVVLVGSDFSITDRHRTPFASVFEGAKGVLPGVVIQAHALAQLLEGRPPDRAALKVNLAITCMLALLGAISGLNERPFVVLILFDGLMVGLYWIAAFVIFHNYRVIVEVLPPSLALLSTSWITEGLNGQRARSQREFIRTSFSQYVPPAVVAELIRTPERLSLQGQRRELTIMFTDVANFTFLSEQLGAQKLGELLNDYFTSLCGIVFDHQGTVLKFIGDGSMSIFNAPVDVPRHAELAVQCAIALNRFGKSFAEEQRQQGLPFGITRFGLHTGEAEVGNYGSFSRKEYGAMGDAVNMTSRLEGINKQFGTSVCVSANTVAQCPGIAFRPLGEIVVRGKTIPVAVFEPIAASGLDAPFVEAYCAAFAAMAAGDPAALAMFEALARENPADGPARIHLARLRRHDPGILITSFEMTGAGLPEPARSAG